MRNHTKFCLAWIICIWTLYPGLATLGHGDDGGAFAPTDEAARLLELDMDDLSKDSIGLKTQRVENKTMSSFLRATGEVQAAETRSFEVNTPVSGVVQSVYVKQGDLVKKGQILASIYSPEVATALAQLVNETTRIEAEKARIRVQYQNDIKLQENQLKLSIIAYKREKELLAEGITARKTFQETENAEESASVKLQALKMRLQQELELLDRQREILIQTSKDQLRIMGLSNKEIYKAIESKHVKADLNVIAPLAGYVILRAVTVGEKVDPTRKLFSIVNLDPIWVMVDVYQEQIPQVHIGDHVVVETPSKDLIEGKISSIGSVVDVATKTLHVRIVVDNKKATLRPGMFVVAQIAFGKENKKQISIPETSIVYQNERPFAYVLDPKDRKFEPTQVQIGGRYAQDVAILTGLKEGDIVVTQGAEQLKAQSLLKPQAQAQHDKESHEDHAAHNKEAEKEPAPTTVMLMIFLGGCVFALTLVLGFVWARKRNRIVRDREHAQPNN